MHACFKVAINLSFAFSCLNRIACRGVWAREAIGQCMHRQLLIGIPLRPLQLQGHKKQKFYSKKIAASFPCLTDFDLFSPLLLLIDASTKNAGRKDKKNSWLLFIDASFTVRVSALWFAVEMKP
jgi:hypothetical protein